MDLASLVLSKTVHRKNTLEKPSWISTSSSIPAFVRINFKIQTNQRLGKTKDFKTPAEDTEKKVSAFQTYLKGEIIKT